MSTLQEELTVQRREDLMRKLKKLAVEKMIVEVELKIFDGIPIPAHRIRERVVAELLKGTVDIPNLANTLEITRGNAHATIWRLHKMGAVEVASTEARGHGTRTNIWKLVRY